MAGGSSRRQGKLKRVLHQSLFAVARAAAGMGQRQGRHRSSSAAASSALTAAQLEAPALRFHRHHGENIRLEDGGLTARRVESFCRGVLFSDRPVFVGERVCLRVLETSSRWSGVLRVGFAVHDPAQLGPLPKYACPDLTKRPGFWAKALPDRYVTGTPGARIHFYVSGNGEVHFGVDGRDRGVFFSGVDTRQPLWAIVDLYGNCTGIELVDTRRSLNNFGNQHPELRDLEEQVTTLSIRRNDSTPYVVANDITPPAQGPSLRPLTFHFCTGRHVRLNSDSTVASRLDEEFAQGYVFTASPITPGERLIVRVLATEDSFIGSLAFGLTNCNPSSVDTHVLPEDSDLLLDRPEYWVVSKDVGSSPRAGEELSFLVRADGAVEFSKNGVFPPSVFMHVDTSQNLWAFWDVYGNTASIQLLGVTSEPLRPQPPVAPLVNIQPPQVIQQHPESTARTGAAECIVCLERPVDCVIYSCGHMCMCHGCAVELWRGRPGGGSCPICRESIRDVIKTFRS